MTRTTPTVLVALAAATLAVAACGSDDGAADTAATDATAALTVKAAALNALSGTRRAQRPLITSVANST